MNEIDKESLNSDGDLTGYIAIETTLIKSVITRRCDRCDEKATSVVQAFLNDKPDSDKMYLCPDCVESYKENSAYWVIESI